MRRVSEKWRIYQMIANRKVINLATLRKPTAARPTSSAVKTLAPLSYRARFEGQSSPASPSAMATAIVVVSITTYVVNAQDSPRRRHLYIAFTEPPQSTNFTRRPKAANGKLRSEAGGLSFAEVIATWRCAIQACTSPGPSRLDLPNTHWFPRT